MSAPLPVLRALRELRRSVRGQVAQVRADWTPADMSERLYKIRKRAASLDTPPQDLETPEAPESSDSWVAEPERPALEVGDVNSEAPEEASAARSEVVDSSGAEPTSLVEGRGGTRPSFPPSEPSAPSPGAAETPPLQGPEKQTSPAEGPAPHTKRTLPPVGGPPRPFRGWSIEDYELLLSVGVRKDLVKALVLELKRRTQTQRTLAVLEQAQQLIAKKRPVEAAPGSGVCPVCEKVPAAGLVEWRGGDSGLRLCRECRELIRP